MKTTLRIMRNSATSVHISRKSPAFTLIEILAVCAIIAILAAILFTSIQGVRKYAYKSKKASTYRQFYMANTLYSQDNNGDTVPAKSGNLLWMDLLKPYLQERFQDSNLYYDPLFDKETLSNPSDITVTGVGLNTNIGMPDKMVENVTWYPGYPWGGRYKLNQITEPGYRILLGDSIQWFLNKNTVDTTRYDSTTTGLFIRFDGSVVNYNKEEALLGVTNPQELRKMR